MEIFKKIEKNLGLVVFISIFVTIVICSCCRTFANSGINYITSDVMSNVKYVENAHNEKNIKEVINDINKNMNKFMKQKASLYTIIFTDDKYADEVEGYYDYKSKSNGLISFGKRTIIVRGLPYDSEWTEQSFYHQLGHAIDAYDYYDTCTTIAGYKYSVNSRFLSIFKEEGHSIREKSYYKQYEDDRAEAFAESFAIYMMYPDFMKNKAPNLYAYIDKIAHTPERKGWVYNSDTDNTIYVGEDGRLTKGWFRDSQTGKKYYFDDKGIMQKGMVIDNIKLSQDGSALE